MKKISVLVVEDSKTMQEILVKILSSDPDISVVGVADDPLIARELVKEKNPDVITLDIMLPHMDGITFLKNIMRLHPMPVVMISTLTEKNSGLALEALAIGAVDYLLKPMKQDFKNLEPFANELIAAIKTAAVANVKKKSIVPVTADESLQSIIYKSSLLKEGIIAIGASTGGIEAIETILFQLPKVLPPVVIIQHIKKEFSLSFSKRISKLYGLNVIEPEDNIELLPGTIYIAPGDKHLLVIKNQKGYFTKLEDTPAHNRHKPSIDLFFKSAAKAVGANLLGILLTGMGSDGAEGMKEIKDAGGMTIAQDEESSIVWGMPGSAVKLGAVDFVLPLDKIPQKILQIIDSKMLGINA